MAPILRRSKRKNRGGKSSANDNGIWLIGKFPFGENVVHALVHSSTLQWNDPKDDRVVIAGKFITTTLDKIPVDGTVFIFSTIKLYLEEVLEKYERDGEIVSRDNTISSNNTVAAKDNEKEDLQDVHSEPESSKSDNSKVKHKEKSRFKNMVQRNGKRKRSLNEPSTVKEPSTCKENVPYTPVLQTGSTHPSSSDNNTENVDAISTQCAIQQPPRRNKNCELPRSSIYKDSYGSSSSNEESDKCSATVTDSDGGTKGNNSPNSQGDRKSRTSKRNSRKSKITCCCTEKPKCTSKGSDDDEQKEVEMIPIGSGQTLIPKKAYDTIDWSDYKLATRKLLTIIFSKRVLATHNMSGKPAPAYQYSPTKFRLNKVKTRDIIFAVTKKCVVEPCHIKTVITHKCCSEKDMARRKKRKKLRKKMDELKKRYGDILDSEVHTVGEPISMDQVTPNQTEHMQEIVKIKVT